MRQARSAGQLPVRAQSGNSARPITGQQQQMMNSQRIMQGMTDAETHPIVKHGHKHLMLC